MLISPALVRVYAVALTLLFATACDIGIDRQRRAIGNQLNDIADRIDSGAARWQDLLPQLEQQLAGDESSLAKQVLGDVRNIVQESITQTGAEAKCTLDYIPRTAAVKLRNLVHKQFHQQPENLPTALVCRVTPLDIQLSDATQTIITVSGGYLSLKGFASAIVDNKHSSAPIPADLVSLNSSYGIIIDLQRLKERHIANENSMVLRVTINGKLVSSTPIHPVSTCTDGVLGPGETDVDCGGPCNPCLAGKRCGGPNDCQSGICSAQQCKRIVTTTFDTVEPKVGAGGSFEDKDFQNCPDGSVAMGINVKRGQQANTVQLLCKRLNPESGTLEGELQRVQSVGHDGGSSSVESDCPGGQALKGMSVTSQGTPAELEPVCVDIRTVVRETAASPAPFAFGPKIIFTVEVDKHSATCGLNEVVVGDRSRFGTFLDQLIMRCRKLEGK